MGDVNFSWADKSSAKAKGLLDDWPLHEIIDQPTRMNRLPGNHSVIDEFSDHCPVCSIWKTDD